MREEVDDALQHAERTEPRAEEASDERRQQKDGEGAEVVGVGWVELGGAAYLVEAEAVLSRRPRDAAVMPLPRPETTPPVMKMYLLM